MARVSRHVFVITVTGELDQPLRAEFEDAEVIADHGVTRLRIASPDASALHGILHRVEALGLELLDVHEEGSPDAGEATSPAPGLPS
jgi:hypothetical protein